MRRRYMYSQPSTTEVQILFAFVHLMRSIGLSVYFDLFLRLGGHAAGDGLYRYHRRGASTVIGSVHLLIFYRSAIFRQYIVILSMTYIDMAT